MRRGMVREERGTRGLGKDEEAPIKRRRARN